MKIKEINLTNFKRFTDLKITGLSKPVKLVVLLGPNGCGKSSVFDAIYAYAMRRQQYLGMLQWQEQEYYTKENVLGLLDIGQQIKVEFYDAAPMGKNGWLKAVYPRTAYRNVSSFNVQQIGQMSPTLKEHRFSRFSEDDMAAHSNYQRLISQGFRDIFEKEDPQTTIGEFRRKIIGKIADNIQRMFPDLVLNSLKNPLEGIGTFSFTKGTTKGFLYENLSGGEKAAFDLILDLVVKRDTFNDTVYCIDEPEAHMSTRLQKDLLDCLYNLIPNNCQLWIATHSIGMIRKARELQSENPDTVEFLDFDGKDFDKPQTIEPVIPTRMFWQKTYQVALDDLAKLVVPDRIVLCEGRPGNDGFDARCYNEIFGNEFTDTQFVSVRGSGDVKNLRPVIQAIAEEAKVISLVDRDDKTDHQREHERQEGTFVLKRRALENYLIDDEIIRLLCEKYKQPQKADDLIKVRDSKLERGNLRNDKAKDAVERIRIVARDDLAIPNSGTTWQSFVCEFMVPLITPDTAIYHELKADVFGDDNANPD